jgi:hypothetical protein
MCESCQKGRLQVGKLGCCTFKKWRELTCPFYVFTKNEFKFGISRFFDHFKRQVLFVSFVISSFFVEKIWLLQKFAKTWRSHVGSTLKKMVGMYLSFLHMLRTLGNCWTLIFRSSFNPSSQIFLQIFHNFEKNSLYFVTERSPVNWVRWRLHYERN